MAHAPTVGPLVLSYETRRGGAFLPLSLAAHVAAVGALLLVPHAARPELPSVAALARDVIVLPVTRTDPPPVVAAPPVRVAPPRPTAPLAVTDPVRPVPATAGVIAVPMTVPDGLPTDDAPVCAGCTLGPGAVPPVPGGGENGPGTGTGTGTVTEPVRVGGVVVPPVKVHHVDPVYPQIAKQAGVQGTVVIDCVIDPMGNVVQARVLKSVPLLTDAAVAAVSQWKYRPSQLNGTPVPVIMTVHVDFRLR